MATATGQRRIQWLLGRVAAKDAVRSSGKDRSWSNLYPAEIEILGDVNGQPSVSGEWTREGGQPLLSLAHIENLAVALVGEAALYRGVGIDVERLGRTGAGFEQVILTDEEREAVTRDGIDLNDEWSLRLWCAKEAVGKSLGRGLVGGASDLTVTSVEAGTGTIRLGLSGGLATALPDQVDQQFTAYTVRQDDLIAAISWRA